MLTFKSTEDELELIMNQDSKVKSLFLSATFQISPRSKELSSTDASASSSVAGLDGGDDDGGSDDINEEDGDDPDGAGGHGGEDAQELGAFEASLEGRWMMLQGLQDNKTPLAKVSY